MGRTPRRPKLPESVRVSYQKIAIVPTGKKHLDGVKPREEEGEILQGCYTASESEISVLPGQPLIEEANTILHEILHAIYYCYGIAIPNKSISLHKQIQEEERVVRLLTNGIMDLMQTNPKIRNYLMKVWEQHGK